MSPVFEQLWRSLRNSLRRRRAPAAPVAPEADAAATPRQEAPPAPEPPAAHPLSDDEIRALAREVIAVLGARGPVDHERVMGHLMPRLRGRAEGAQVAEIVSDLLAHLEGP